jgi:hypothetical protein
MGETVAKGFNKLGWHWWPSDSTIQALSLYIADTMKKNLENLFD